MITHMWFTGHIGHSYILRIYRDGRNPHRPKRRFPHFSAWPMMKTLLMWTENILRSIRR